jgi:hypothetical protein
MYKPHFLDKNLCAPNTQNMNSSPFFCEKQSFEMSRGSSVTVVSDYRLDDLAIRVRSLVEAKDFFSSLCVQTSSGAHPASFLIGTGNPFPKGKAQLGCDSDHSPTSSAKVRNEYELHLLSPPKCFHGM